MAAAVSDRLAEARARRVVPNLPTEGVSARGGPTLAPNAEFLVGNRLRGHTYARGLGIIRPPQQFARGDSPLSVEVDDERDGGGGDRERGRRPDQRAWRGGQANRGEESAQAAEHLREH